MIWTLRAWRARLVGRWSRRHWRRQPISEPAPAPHVTAPASPIDTPEAAALAAEQAAQLWGRTPDPHTVVLRRHYATQQIPPGHARPLAWHQYERLARWTRAEHGEKWK